MWLVDLNYNFECDWLIELSDNNLASELVENRRFFKPITIKEIVIFMINSVTSVRSLSGYDWLQGLFGSCFNFKLPTELG